DDEVNNPKNYSQNKGSNDTKIYASSDNINSFNSQKTTLNSQNHEVPKVEKDNKKLEFSFKTPDEYLAYYKKKIEYEDKPFIKDPFLDFIPTRLNKNGLPDLRFKENRHAYLHNGKK
ncbi:unnamed protein product, partial [Brachionus calyciflorus]